MNQPSTYSNEINEAISKAGFAEVLTLEKAFPPGFTFERGQMVYSDQGE